ncbi:nitrate ABC transporter substrate-binding protein [Kaistia sp. 32K]|uniref:PhnD/SsuA/transferrin family substrate-binding protein n=1 Tax=Kaistia sp. 32K TaxID=2795690 RepID=UPI001915E5B2|nr:PhnD/SsuA/transferrin family substrate-binding protein [Kaistia sp. 32K]BCP52246.1 nitrate ABC transporter substrate-binding protein [Kaistia sp. 32K]
MNMRTLGVSLLALAGALGLVAAAHAADGKPVLKVGSFDPAITELAKQSGLFDDAPYIIEAAKTPFGEQVAALNAGTIDVAFYGATTALRQQAAETPAWTAQTAPIKVIAGFSPPPIRDIPKVVTAARTDAGVATPADLKGKSWAFSVGGDTPTVYLASLKAAGLTHNDITPLENDNYGTNIAAFHSGQAQVLTAFADDIADLLQSGDAKVIYSSDDLGVAVFYGFAARSADLADPVKEARIRDYLVRYNKFESEWYGAHPDKAREAFIKVGQLPPDLADFIVSRHKGTASINFNDALLKGVRKSADVLAENGDISPIEDITVTFDDRYNKLLNSVDYQY